MGNDGGSIPDRRDLVRNKPKAEQADKANQTRARWFFCALSKRPLQEPIVSCDLGKLYNKDAVIEFLLDRSAFGDGEEICRHIRSLKDVKTLELTPNATPKSDALDSSIDRGCRAQGCLFPDATIRKGEGQGCRGEGGAQSPSDGQLDVCPQCAKKYDRSEDVRMLNPGPEEEERMRSAMERRRAIKGKGKKRKAAPEGAEGEQPPGKKKSGSRSGSATPLTGPTIVGAANRTVASSLAMEEAKRKAHMSEAVKSLYRPKDGKGRKETFMTMGTFTRYA
ncbi:Rtf2 RING-finger-domain-containing protein [Russula vinacea]|nr:Rtf2 RING-finger-domain-containing protein [Russula vinacea]